MGAVVAMKVPANHELIIEGLIANLDFDKIVKVMNLTDWTWGTPAQVPSLVQMKETARSLLTEMLESGYREHGTGGFEAWQDGQHFGIRFVVADSGTDW